MPRKMILLPVLLLWLVSAQAQRINEWVKQKQTQVKYLLEQIAALKMQTGYLKKGYRIANDGTGLISNIKKSDLSLHTTHFNSLKTVNPRVRNYSKVAAIISLQQQMTENRQKVLNKVMSSGQLNDLELAELKKIFSGLAQEGVKDLEELSLITSDGELQLSDDERIKRIDLLYEHAKAGNAFQNRWGRNVLVLAELRRRQMKDMEMLRAIEGLKK